MNVERVTAELRSLYPGSNIKLLPSDNPSEIVCELPYDNLDSSVAVAVIDRSAPHKHLVTKETYKIIRGEVILFAGDEKLDLKEGDEYVIHPGTVHSVEANEGWIEVLCEPAWTPEDHILV